MERIKKAVSLIPEFCMSHWLWRIPLAIVFLQQGLAKWPFSVELGDLLTRFSGIVICSIMTGVIWMSQPESFSDVILYDNFHVLLWVGGLFFALRGNRT